MQNYVRILLIVAIVIEVIMGGNVNGVVTKEEFKQLKATVSRLEDIISVQADKIQRLENMLEKAEQDNRRQPVLQKRAVDTASKARRYADNTVAFFATLSRASLDHLGSHQNIVFEDVLTNIGNCYNNHQGVFVAPVSGLYLVTTSVLSRQDREFWADMVVNGTTVVRLNGRGTDGRHGTGTQTVIMALKKGDDVSIQNSQTDDGYWGDKYTSYGGFLIQEFEEDVSSIVG